MQHVEEAFEVESTDMSRRVSTQPELDSDEEEEENEEMKQEDKPDEIQIKKQKYMQPLEVKYHIEKLWEKEKGLLSLIYGRFYPDSEKGRGQYKPQSLGA